MSPLSKKVKTAEMLILMVALWVLTVNEYRMHELTVLVVMEGIGATTLSMFNLLRCVKWCKNWEHDVNHKT